MFANPSFSLFEKIIRPPENAIVRGAFIYNIAGFKTPSSGCNVGILPITLDEQTWDDLVDFSDVLPTLAELAGADTTGLTLDGQVIVDTDGNILDNRDFVYNWYADKAGNPPVEFVQDEQYKLYGDGQLFDISADPTEDTDLSGVIGSLDAADQLAIAELQSTMDHYAAEQIPEPTSLVLLACGAAGIAARRRKKRDRG